MKPSKNNPWAAMDAIVNTNPEPMGDGWFSTQEYVDRYKCTRDSAYGRLLRMKAAGLVDRWSGMGVTNRRTTTKWRVKPV
jgi:hypothetical protein